MNPQSIPAVKNMIRKISVKESKAFLEEILKQNSANAAFRLIRDTYGDTLNHNGLH